MKSTTNSSKKSRKKLLWAIPGTLLGLLLLAVVVFCVLWHPEIATAASLKQLRPANDAHQDGAVYRMDVSGGFYLEDFLAQGGAESDSELIDFLCNRISRGLLNLSFESPEIACSSFTARTQDGDALFARNYDFAKTNTCLVFTQGTGERHATISTADLQFIGIDENAGIQGLADRVLCLAAPYIPLDGINDAGVSCGIYMTYQGQPVAATDQRTEKPDITSTTLLRLILDYADNVEEAVEIAESYDLHDSAKTSYHYMVADASGRSAILEWVGGSALDDNDGTARKLVVTYNDGDSAIGEAEGASDFQWVTNFIIQPDYYADNGDKKGLDRYQEIYTRLSATDGIVADEDGAMEILAAVGRRTWDNDDRNNCTVHSVVYNLTERSVYWVSNENYTDETAIFHFSLKP